MSVVLTLNAGSSSLKFAVFDAAGTEFPPAIRGAIDGIGETPQLRARDAAGKDLADRQWPRGCDQDTMLHDLLDWVTAQLGHGRLAAVGHRIVHGGRRFSAPVRVTEAALRQLEALTPLAPLHQPHNLAPIRAMAALRPDVPQVACFDTAFHHGMPEVATRLALPQDLAAQGLRRYGFHGLSYEFVAARIGQLSPRLAAGRTVVAHLGNGASLCALRAGRSIDTTMGFSTLDGLMMGTRCGALDPGAMLFMQQALHMDAAAIKQALYHRSGLLGVSGISGDMRALRADGGAPAKAAIELFVHRLLQEVAAMAASLRGIDGLVFTAGIGEHDAALRAAACDGLQWLGVSLDQDANQAASGRISASASGVEVWVIPTDEEAIIARHTVATVAA